MTSKRQVKMCRPKHHERARSRWSEQAAKQYRCIELVALVTCGCLHRLAIFFVANNFIDLHGRHLPRVASVPHTSIPYACRHHTHNSSIPIRAIETPGGGASCSDPGSRYVGCPVHLVMQPQCECQPPRPLERKLRRESCIAVDLPSPSRSCTSL